MDQPFALTAGTIRVGEVAMNFRVSRSLTAASVSCLFAFVPLATVHATPPLYTITDLGALSVSGSGAAGINASGEVTGYSYTDNGAVRAILYDGETLRDLGTLGGNSQGFGINNKGELTGYYVYSMIAPGYPLDHAFLYNGTTMIDLGTLPGGITSSGNAINDLGEVAGVSSTTSTGGGGHAFLYNGTTMIDLGTPPGYFFESFATGVNAGGEVTGAASGFGPTHAFLYDGTRMIDLGTLPGYESFGHAINTSGQVTGYLLQNNGGSTQAFLYNGATMIGLGTPSGFSDSNGWGINDRNEVVGDLDRASNETAFLYTGGAIYDLNGLIAPADPLHGRVRFSLAAGINNTGQIAANGCYTSGPLNGECHAFRLDLVLFAGTPGTANCHGQSVSALARQYGGLNAAAAALGFSSVGALQNAILAFCGG